MKTIILILTILCFANKPIYSQRVVHSNIGAFGCSGKVNSFYTVSFNSTLGENLNNERIDKSILLRPFNFNNTIVNETKIHISIYPIPTINKIWIQTDLESIYYEIFNSSGALCKRGNSKEISLGELTKGIYHIQIFNQKQKVHSQKVILE